MPQHEVTVCLFARNVQHKMTHNTAIKVPLQLLDHAPKSTLQYAHVSDAGADLCAAEPVILKPFERALVATGVAIQLPVGYVAYVNPRSGLAVKQGVTVLNAPGTIDAGYRGEIKVPLINLDPHNTVSFSIGDRIAQLVVQPVEHVDFIQVEVLESSDRKDHGFGSTGITSSQS